MNIGSTSVGRVPALQAGDLELDAKRVGRSLQVAWIEGLTIEAVLPEGPTPRGATTSWWVYPFG